MRGETEHDQIRIQTVQAVARSRIVRVERSLMSFFVRVEKIEIFISFSSVASVFEFGDF